MDDTFDAQSTELSTAPPRARRMMDVTVFEQVIAKLREIDRRTGIERTLAIGELVLKEFFGGDPAAWRDRRRNKNSSIRRLAVRPECPFSRSALNDAVGVYVAVRGTPSVHAFGHVCASHIASVLPLPGDERHQLLERAERERWSVRYLRQQVVVLRRMEGERRGRPPAPPVFQTLSGLRDGLRQVSDAVSRMETAPELNVGVRAALPQLAGELERLTSRITVLAHPDGAHLSVFEAEGRPRKITAG